MIFIPRHWKLVEAIFSAKQELLDEFHASQDKVKSKVNMTTHGFKKPLFDKPMGILPYTFDPLLWTEDEMRNAKVDNTERRWPSYAPPKGVELARQFPAIRQFYWTTLYPGGKVTPHWGINGVVQHRTPDHWRLQICWLPGDNASFHTETEFVRYEEDLCFGFNDGLEVHWAQNDGTLPRTTIIIDVWRDQVENADVPHPSAIRKDQPQYQLYPSKP